LAEADVPASNGLSAAVAEIVGAVTVADVPTAVAVDAADLIVAAVKAIRTDMGITASVDIDLTEARSAVRN